MRVRSRGVNRCPSSRTAYEFFEFSESAMFHVNEGQSKPGLLAFRTASATQPTKAIANAE